MSHTWTLHGGPVRWDDCFPGPFVQWPYWGVFSAKPTHSHAVFWCIYQPTSPCLTLSAHTEPISQGNCWKCLTHAMYAIAFKVAWELCRHWRFELIICKSCWDLSRLFNDYLVCIVLRQTHRNRKLPYEYLAAHNDGILELQDTVTEQVTCLAVSCKMENLTWCKFFYGRFSLRSVWSLFIITCGVHALTAVQSACQVTWCTCTNSHRNDVVSIYLSCLQD